MPETKFFPTSDVVSSDRILYTPSRFARASLLHLQEIGTLKALKPHTSHRDNLSSFLFFIVLSGEGSLSYDEKHYNLITGDMVFIDCSKPYEKYFSLEYDHEGKDDQCFVCGIEKASVIEEERKMCGYFCIITSAEMSAKEALDLYKSRDASEKLFKADKSFPGNWSLRVYTGESLEGRMLIAFVALIIRNRMYTKLKDEEEELLEKPNDMNVPASIRELEKIEMIRQADGVYRLDHAVTATQKTILKAFGIDTNYVKRKAREISDQLNPKVLKVRT